MTATFSAFPEKCGKLRDRSLAYVTYSPVANAAPRRGSPPWSVDRLVAAGLMRVDPIVGEDFVPVSAAGIFQSDLGDNARQSFTASPNQRHFEAALGRSVLNEFELYATIDQGSIENCLAFFNRTNLQEYHCA